MTEEIITNKLLLTHMQGMKNDLQLQISAVDKNLSGQIGGLEGRIGGLEKKVQEGFTGINERLDALQEDLEETMKVQGRHTRKLARLGSSR